jgi:2-dehydro-3-deoxygalactonokinase
VVTASERGATDLASAELIGLDWGSSQLRAMLIGPRGRMLASRTSAAGASKLDGRPASFAAELDALIGDWHAAGLPVLACGMVGSQHGWAEAPYANCPASAADLSVGTVSVDWRGLPVRLLPGLRCETPEGVPDLMRGEETQLIGALLIEPALAEQACLVMPGTHSKWAHVADAGVQGFTTHMTGELFALLREHSVLSRLMPGTGEHVPQAFADGVRAARDDGDAGLPHQLFAVRSLGLARRMRASALSDYLSGLLIGHEVRAGLRWRDRAHLTDAPLRLIGETSLCQRYALALHLFGAGPAVVLPQAAAAGLWQLSRATQGIKQ